MTRLALVACALFAIVALQAVGHGLLLDGGRTATAPVSAATQPATATASDACVPASCDALAAPGDTHQVTSWWDICLRVLTVLSLSGLALAVLFVLVLLGRAPRDTRPHPALTTRGGPRQFGLALATTAILRT